VVRRFVPVLAIVAVAGATAVAADSRRDASTRRSEKRAVLRVVKRGQRAILANHPKTVCRLLTRRARKNSLILYGLDTHPDGTPRPKPKTCARAIKYMIEDAKENGGLGELRRGGVLYGTKVVSIRRRRAHVRKAEGTEIHLVKRRGRWYGDYANFAPFDGTSGY
jgi:hypothetical protein